MHINITSLSHFVTAWKEKKTTPLLDVPDESKVAARFKKRSLPSNTCIICKVHLVESLTRFLIVWGFDKERENYRSICYLYLLLPIEGHYWRLEPFPRYNRLKAGKQLDWLPILLSGITGPYKFIHPWLSSNRLHVFPSLNENSKGFLLLCFLSFPFI